MLAQLTMISSTTLRARFVTSGERAEGCSAGSLGSPMASLVRFQTSTTCWRMAERLSLGRAHDVGVAVEKVAKKRRARACE